MTATLSATLQELVRPVPTLKPSATCREALRLMFQHPEARCMAVCSREGGPVGLLMNERFFLRSAGSTGSAMPYHEPVSSLMNRMPLTVDIEMPLESVKELAAARALPFRSDCIIVTDQGRFCGVVYAGDLDRI